MKRITFSIAALLMTFGAHAQTGNESLGTGAGVSITSGDYNVMIGDSAGTSLSSGLNNTFVGEQAGFNQISASDNTFIGQDAGRSNITGTDNTFIGKMAGLNSTATDNTFIGTEAGLNNTTGSDNTFIGEESGEANTTGRDNTFIGEDSGFNNTDGDDNTFIGSTAGRTNTTGYRNTFVGNEAGYDNTTGFWNTSIGDSSLTDNGVGHHNTALGKGAGCATEHGDFNTFVGAYAGHDNNRTNNTSNANRNTYLGVSAGGTNREGSDNVGIGCGADFDGTNRSRCTFIGGTGRSPYGRSSNTLHMVSANDAMAVGYDSQTSATYGIGIGSHIDQHGVESVGIGALQNTEAAADYSLLIGSRAFTDQPYTIGLGYFDSIQGRSSIGVGAYTTVTGDSSLAIGSYGSLTGARSIGIGSTSSVSSDNSIAIGSGASVSGFNSMAIGHGTSVTAANEVFIGNVTTTSIGGAVNWTATSDGRFKTNVTGNVPGMDFIRELKPVTYNFDVKKLDAFNSANGLPTAHKEGVVYSGFIAQDVHATANRLGYDFSGVKVPENDENQMYGLRYAEFVVPLVKAAQELDQRVEDLENQVDAQNALIVAQQELIEKYNNALNSNSEEMAKLKGDFIQLEDKVESESILEASTDKK